MTSPTHRLSGALAEAIDQIPGGDGWWHSSGQEVFEGIAKQLLLKGLFEEEILQILEAAYGAVAGEFGD